MNVMLRKVMIVRTQRRNINHYLHELMNHDEYTLFKECTYCSHGNHIQMISYIQKGSNTMQNIRLKMKKNVYTRDTYIQTTQIQQPFQKKKKKET